MSSVHATGCPPSTPPDVLRPRHRMSSVHATDGMPCDRPSRDRRSPCPAVTAGTLNTCSWGYGAVVAHLPCMQGVRGSNPLSSTTGQRPISNTEAAFSLPVQQESTAAHLARSPGSLFGGSSASAVAGQALALAEPPPPPRGGAHSSAGAAVAGTRLARPISAAVVVVPRTPTLSLRRGRSSMMFTCHDGQSAATLCSTASSCG
jgi:hypothetical protein